MGAKCLGIQIGYKIDRNINWKDKLDKVNGIATRWGWGGLLRSAKEGRSMVVQSCYYGRLRYYLYSYAMHKNHVKQVEKDASYLIWKKDPDMKLDEEDRKCRRWIAKKAEHRPRCKGGAGLMSWSRHPICTSTYVDFVNQGSRAR